MEKSQIQTNNAAVDNKEKQFSDLFDQYHLQLSHYANTFIPNFDQCKDIVQEVFTKLWEIKLPHFSPVELDKFLYRSVKNGCVDLLRKQKVRQNHRIQILENLLKQEEQFFPEIELKELAEKINEAIRKLPDQTAQIFKMSRNEAKPYEAIADQLKISEKTVEYHISKALHFLRLELKDYLIVIASISGLFKF
jgi:RNA polymerase sigma-70 factor (ECF subfamily)